MQAEEYSFNIENKIAVTPGNLAKIEEFESKNERESIYYYAANSLLYKGYYKLLEPEKGREAHFGSAKVNYLLHRVLFLNHLSSVPITKKNSRYLEHFSDQERYSIGTHAALQLAKAHNHFGNIEETREMLNIASKDKTLKSQIEEIVILEEPVTDGTITGTVILNGEPLKGNKVALFQFTGSKRGFPAQAYNIDIYLAFNLVDAVKLGESGEFEFSNLGEGEYYLALQFNRNRLSFKTQPEDIKLSNNPGIIKIDSENSEIGLETIELEF